MLFACVLLLSLLLFLDFCSHQNLYDCKRLRSIEILVRRKFIRKNCDLKLIIHHLRRVECNPHPLGHHNVE
jgi:hypothetical protein